MKFAPVCPIHIYEHLAECGPEYLGDYFLLLAHDVLANQKRYEAFFKGKNYTIIMDNSVIELGDACDARTLLEAAQTVDATCVAIPDVLQQGEATFQRAGAFLDEWVGMKKEREFGLMYIPQGKDTYDFLQCIDAGLHEFGHMFDWIGVARNTTGRIFPSRKQVMSLCWALAMKYSLVRKRQIQKFHLLGFSEDMQDDVDTCFEWARSVLGIDSAVPLRLGSQGKEIKDRAINFVDPGPRGDWWDTVKVPALSEEATMAANVLMTRKIIGELPWGK